MEKRKTLEEIDSNLKVESTLGETNIRFYDVRNDPFEVFGLYNYREEAEFKRLPDDLAKRVNSGVAQLARNTSGGRVRFSTDSAYVAIRAVMPPQRHQFSHMPITGTSGFDLYMDDPETGESRFCKPFIPDLKTSVNGFESKISLPDKGLRHFTLNFPLYDEVKALYIGLESDATVGEGMRYRDLPPIVFYGSSITQGGCASRPGNAYANVIGRRFNIDYLNLGFSGSGKGEDTIVDYMATLPMSIFVSDYDHNAPNAEHLRATHLKMYQKIRAAHPDIPYIMLSKPDITTMRTNRRAEADRRMVVFDTYRYAIEHGDLNAYLIDGDSIFRGKYEDMCTVDGCHPNDLGFALMADAIEAIIRRTIIYKKYYS